MAKLSLSIFYGSFSKKASRYREKLSKYCCPLSLSVPCLERSTFPSGCFFHTLTFFLSVSAHSLKYLNYVYRIENPKNKKKNILEYFFHITHFSNF